MNLVLNPDGSSRTKITIASFAFMGLAHLLYLKQTIKGVLLAAFEVLVLFFIPQIVKTLTRMVTLGDPHPELSIKFRDHSMFLLIDGIMILAVLLLVVAVYGISIRSAQDTYQEYCVRGTLPSNRQFFSELGNKAFTIFGLSPLVVMVLFFVVVPLVFSVCVSFTNYSAPSNIPPNNLVDWVGLKNYGDMFGGNAQWTKAFGRVAIWTVVWATLATMTCYAGGIWMAVILKDVNIKIAPIFRSIFILPYAVPTVVSMLIWQNLLNGSFGTVNRTLIALGIISKGTVIPWLTDATLAKAVCVLINLWAGFPYFMLLTMGTMTSISTEVYEAARIDGASKWQMFRRITLPMVLYQTMPLIIMSFAHNINNFGAIFFLTGGNPQVADSTVTSAKGTDILVTWIYNLTINLQKYNYAAVLGVCIFMVLAPFAIFNFVRTKSYQEGEL